MYINSIVTSCCRFGRKKTLYVSILGTAAVGTGQAFSGSYVTYIVLRFLLATFAISTFTCSFVIGAL